MRCTIDEKACAKLTTNGTRRGECQIETRVTVLTARSGIRDVRLGGGMIWQRAAVARDDVQASLAYNIRGIDDSVPACSGEGHSGDNFPGGVITATYHQLELLATLVLKEELSSSRSRSSRHWMNPSTIVCRWNPL